MKNQNDQFIFTSLIVLICAFVISVAFFIYAPPLSKSSKTKVYLVSTTKYDEEWIERVYLKPEKAQEYVDAYREHHDYSIKEIVVEE